MKTTPSLVANPKSGLAVTQGGGRENPRKGVKANLKAGIVEANPRRNRGKPQKSGGRQITERERQTPKRGRGKRFSPINIVEQGFKSHT